MADASSIWPDKGQRSYSILVTLLLIALVAFVGLKAKSVWREYKFIGTTLERNTITVSGEGKINTVPDIAAIDLGTTIEKKTVVEAQKENTRIMDALIAKLGSMGVAKKDIQTSNYSIYPAYDYSDGRQSLRAYTVSQNVRVKVRNLDSVGNIIGEAGALGVNQVGGINFTVDEPESIRQEARLKAMANAREKAEALAAAAGVKLRRVISFSESSGGITPYPPIYYAKEMAAGMGGAVDAPSIEAGSTDIIVNAQVTYEIE